MRFFLITNKSLLFFPRDENRSQESYDGPAGMEVGGIIESNWDEVVDNFDAMNLKEKLLRGIYAYGFEKPSAIQQRAIIPCIKGRDVIAQAQSGKHSRRKKRLAINLNRHIFILRYRKDGNILHCNLANHRH